MHEIQMLGLLDHDVLSSIELPFLPEPDSLADPSATPIPHSQKPGAITKAEADKFDMDIFSDVRVEPTRLQSSSTRNSLISSIGSYRSSSEGLKRSMSTRTSETSNSRIQPIQESPYPAPVDIPSEERAMTGASSDTLLAVAGATLSSSPSQSSIRSIRSHASTVSPAASTTVVGTSSRSSSLTRPLLKGATRFTPSWFWNTFSRSGPSLPETSSVSAAGITSPKSSEPPTTPLPGSSSSIAAVHGQSSQRLPKPMLINNSTVRARAGGLGRNADEEILTHRGSLTRHSPMGTPPRDDITFGVKRRSGTLSSAMSPMGASSSPLIRTNPLRPLATVSSTQSSLASRWQHIFPEPLSKHDIKWKAMISPGCLPLTVEYFPTASELDTAYDLSPYDFVVDPPEMRSFLVKPPTVSTNNPDIIRRAWALVIMRGMVALRLAQGFQLVLRPHKSQQSAFASLDSPAATIRRTSSYMTSEEPTPRPAGAPDVLKTPDEPVFLSMSNEIHRIAYTGETIQVRRYVRRIPRAKPFDYQCLIWPKLGVGYTELRTSFVSHGLENYGWNR